MPCPIGSKPSAARFAISSPLRHSFIRGECGSGYVWEGVHCVMETLAHWGMGSAPARPRVELLERAELLLALCNAARRYMAADRHVGEWTLAPSPPLRGHSPAQVLARHGREGLWILLAELATVAPLRSAGPVEMPSLEQLRASLCQRRGPRGARADRTDRRGRAGRVQCRDLDAQLHEATLQDE